VRAGARIWHDIAAFADLLMQVNNRAELRDHDAELLMKVAPALLSPPDASLVPADMVARLDPLYGRSGALDLILREQTRVNVNALREIVNDLLTELRVQNTGAAKPPQW
jgi:hypothetical protein